MNEELFNTVVQIAFFVIIVVFAIIALLSVFIVTKYGRTRAITILTSMIFLGFFILQSLAAFGSLRSGL